MGNAGLSKLDGLRNDLERVVSAFFILQQAAEDSRYLEQQDLSNALFVVWERLADISRGISEWVDLEYQTGKEGRV